jgi:hypothetical protein
MRPTVPFFTRRALCAAALASVLVPRLAQGQTASDTTAGGEGAAMRIRITFADQSFTATLEDNPSARDLWSMLPLDLTVEDYGGNEKIAYLPRPLTQEGSAPFPGEAPGDLGYWAPWSNLAMYHGDYRYEPGLIRLGRLDDGPRPLLTRGAYPVRIEGAE